MDERRFTLEEARAMLPELRERLPRLREARRSLIDSSRRIGDAVAADGGGVAGTDWFDAQQTLKTELTLLAEQGVLLRDPESGLVDFPSERDGRRVFLCWRVSEDDVAWYHESDVGFGSRKPL
jgi:hypothetical protein